MKALNKIVFSNFKISKNYSEIFYFKSNFKVSKFYFSTINSNSNTNINNKNNSHDKNSNFNINSKTFNEKLRKEGGVKLYDTKYTFNSEKLMIHSSAIFLLISSSAVVFTNLPILAKMINAVVVLIPSMYIITEYLLNNTRFVKAIKILPGNKIEVHDMWNKKEVIEIRDLNKAINDPRVEKQKNYLNHQVFIIFTNKKNKALYHVPRDGVFLNEEVFHNILEGRELDKK
jgi:hypothetical protein